MDWDILKKEQEYYKENELIESKTKALLQKVDDAMKMQDNLLKDSSMKMVPDTNKRHIPPQCMKEGKEQLFSHFSEISLDDPTVPTTNMLNDMGQRGMHNFYRAKIKALKEECDKLQVEVRNKNTESKQLQKDLNQITEDKEKWFLQYNLGKNQISKQEHQITVCNSRIQTKESENIAMKKEIDCLKREIKFMTQNLSANEIKLNKALEENERNKVLLKNLKKEEKDLKESHKKQIQELTCTVQQIEKHKNELIHGFKKQLQLIDNLKKQKAHLETFNLAQLAEGEFMKILDWKGEF